MALARQRAQARRVKDKWKSKLPYRLVAPATFNQHHLGDTMADEPQKVIGRSVEITMNEITGDLKQMHIKLAFRVSDVQDRTATTTFAGHAMTSDYVRRLTRRGHTKIPAVFDVKTKDGSRIRVKPFAISDRRCQTTQAQAIRAVMQEMLEAAAKKHTQAGFLKEVLMGELTTSMYKEARKIHPVRRIEVAKTEILKAPTVEVDETPVMIVEPEPEPVPETEGDAGDVADADTAEGDIEGVADDAGDEGDAGDADADVAVADSDEADEEE